MSKIINLQTWLEIESITDKKLRELISEGLDYIPEEVEKILGLWVREQAIINVEDFKKLLIDYIIYSLKKSKIDISLDITMWVNYLSELLTSILHLSEESEFNEVMSNPYYIHWANMWEYKKAGDASVYKYIFWEPGLRDTLSRENYISFAMSWYLNHFWNQDFSKSVWIILPQISWISRERDFFRRWVKSF
jgi:hypothetical protein